MRLQPIAIVGMIALSAGLAGGLTGCQSASKALGLAKVTPDEFRVVTKAPLVVPPDYALRPPAPGEPRPQELQPESAARAALAGATAGALRSEAERMFALKAGSDRADPLIRFVVDDENGDIAHKDESFASRVLNWRKEPAATSGGTDQPAPVDAASEDARIKSLTGGAPVVIARQRSTSVLKLPGL